MDEHNPYKSGMRFFEVSSVNMEVKTKFNDIPFRGPSWDLMLDFGETAMLTFYRLKALKLDS